MIALLQAEGTEKQEKRTEEKIGTKAPNMSSKYNTTTLL